VAIVLGIFALFLAAKFRRDQKKRKLQKEEEGRNRALELIYSNV